MKIGYEGYSSENNGIADRRRILHWAEERHHEIVNSRNPDADIIVITSSADLTYWAQAKTTKPLILDVVDGLIGEQNPVKDFVRGVGHMNSHHTSSFKLKKFSDTLILVAKNCNSVICSSLEQVQEWRKHGVKAFDILDFHEEIPRALECFDTLEKNSDSLFWEGLPPTIQSMTLLNLLRSGDLSRPYSLNVLTKLESYRYMNRYIKLDVLRILEKQIDSKSIKINLIEWTPDNLVEWANNSSIGVIPIQGFKGYNHLKAENRLLIMWRLGLPVLTSALPSYVRTMKDAGIPGICHNEKEWATKVTQLNRSISLRQEHIGKAQEYLDRKHRVEDLLEKWDFALGVN